MGYLNAVMLLIYIVTASVQDIKTRRISIMISVIFAVSGALLCAASHREVKDVMTALIPAVVMFVLSILSDGGIGTGDAIFAGTCAMYLPADELLLSGLLAWGACCIAGLFILLGCQLGYTAQKVRTKGLPFTAFMTVPIVFICAGKLL